MYFDDILVNGDNAKDHLMNLRALFKRLEEKGLRCNRERCVFAQVSIDYLGHTLSRQGIAKGSKVDAILEMPTPKNISTLKSFLASVQFYSKFLPPYFSEITEPLYKLTRKGQQWKWGEEEATSFKKIKRLLCTDTVLAHYDPSLRWVYFVTPQNVELDRYYFIALQTEASVRFSIFLKSYRRHKDATAKYNQDKRANIQMLKTLKWFQKLNIINVRVIPRGPTWKRHLGQLRPRYGSDQDDDPCEILKSVLSTETLPARTDHASSSSSNQRNNPRSPTGDEYGRHNPRRSARTKRLPKKYCC